MARAFPDNVVLRTEGVPETAAAVTAMEQLISRGAKIIFATSFGHYKYAYEVAKRHPDVVVLHEGGVVPPPGLPNFGTYWGSVFEPVYETGIVAGRMTRTGKLGYVVAFPIPATFDNVDAFTMGARSVNPAVTTSVVFTENWCDPAKQRAAAARLLAQGVDVLAQHQDCTRTVLQAAEAKGVYAIGYHYDGSETAPKSWLAGAVWDWRRLFVDIVQTILDGTFPQSKYHGNFVGGLRAGDNPFILTELGPAVDPTTRQLVEATENRLRAGFSPFDGPLSDRDGRLRLPAGRSPTYAEILGIDWFVPGVIGPVRAR